MNQARKYDVGSFVHTTEQPKPEGLMPYEDARVLIDRLVINRNFEGKLILEVMGKQARVLVDKSQQDIVIVRKEDDL